MKINRLIVLIAILTVLIALFQVYPGTALKERSYHKKFQHIFIEKIELAQQYSKRLRESSFEESVHLVGKIQNSRIKIFIYQNDSLFFWSNNSVNIPTIEFFENSKSQLVHLDNSLFYFVSDSTETRKIVALIRLQNKFSYENDFLKSGVLKEYGLPEGSEIDLLAEKNTIVNEEGKALFGVKLGSAQVSYFKEVLSTIFFFIILIALLIISYLRIKTIIKASKRAGYIVALTILFIAIRWIMNRIGVSPLFLLSFDSFTYASYIAPSLGDLLINSLLFFWFGFMVFRLINIKPKINKLPQGCFILTGIVLVAVYQYVLVISYSLIDHSSLNMVIHKVNEINLNILIAYLILILNHFSFGLLLIWFFYSFKERVTLKKQVVLFLGIIVVLFAVFYVLKARVNVVSYLFLLISYILLVRIIKKDNRSLFITYLLLFVLILTLYLQFFNIYFSSIKEEKQLVSIAENLANEHDPLAEYNFIKLSEDITGDTLLNDLVVSGSAIEKVEKRLENTHLEGYWRNYNLKYTSVCSPEYQFFDETTTKWWNCYSFYDSLIAACGMQIPFSNFYYLNNYNGKISYTGVFHLTRGKEERKLFIELDSRGAQKLLGYPELLVDEKLRIESIKSEYSYAKYHKNALTTQTGDYGYSVNAAYFMHRLNGNSGVQFVKEKDYKHLVYFPDEDNLIVISLPIPRILDYAVIFAYLFILNFIFIVVFISFTHLEILKYRSISDYRSRIQLTIVLILVFSMLVVGLSTITILIRNHNKDQMEILKEKIQSVYIELEHKISGEKTLRKDWSSDKYANLNQLLVKFSEVFYSDINLYSPTGELIAASRTELFAEGLKGTQMNPDAFFNLSLLQKKQFIHKEHIYDLKYLSAYIPFYNSNGDVLVYLNLPYFSQQKDLQNSITQLTVTIVNIYLLLMIITLFIAYLVSNQLTRPIELLRNKLSELKVGKSYERIVYNRRDEIGKLVNQYNLTVTELEKSINLLAKSERETAWREMAKQIAHEIKNPLTPMRLSVQQLMRTWNDRRENFEDYFYRTTDTLLEQIDTLSNIATEFSNFAKMPETTITSVNLIRILDKVVQLFSSNSECRLEKKYQLEEVLVYADPEQLSRVFINIIKNAVQAIPENRHGIVAIDVSRLNTKIQVTIQDNGKGIDKANYENLFQPNFTTKTSGTGLGLAIVKKILDEFNASIDFKSKLGKGTTFIITFSEYK